MFGRKKKDADKQPKQKTTHNTVQTAQAVSSYYYKRLPVTTLPNKNMRLNNGLVLQELELPIAEFTISTPDGDGWLVFSTLRVYVVIKGKGNHIFLETAMIDEIKQKGYNITI